MNICQQLFWVDESCAAVCFTQLWVIAIFEPNRHLRCGRIFKYCFIRNLLLSLPVKEFKQEAQLLQRDCATPRTHFTRDRRMDKRKDGQKAVARTRYAVCVACKKGLRPKKPTEKIAGQWSYTVRGHWFWYQWGHQMQTFCITEEVNNQNSETIFRQSA